jgi:predicted TIM-barrel fold metal-dependent hydrolase
VAVDGRAADAASILADCVRRGAVGARLRAPAREAPPDWLECDPFWAGATDLGVPICVHLPVQQHTAGVPRLADVLRRFPRLRVVLDHVANPPWSQAAPDYGLGQVLPLADLPGVYIKFATVNLDRLAAAGVPAERALRRLVDVFGAERVVWGSDAPNTPGDYEVMLDRIQAALSQLNLAERGLVLGGTALRVYPALECQSRQPNERSDHARVSVP